MYIYYMFHSNIRGILQGRLVRWQSLWGAAAGAVRPRVRLKMQELAKNMFILIEYIDDSPVCFLSPNFHAGPEQQDLDGSGPRRTLTTKNPEDDWDMMMVGMFGVYRQLLYRRSGGFSRMCQTNHVWTWCFEQGHQAISGRADGRERVSSSEMSDRMCAAKCQNIFPNICLEMSRWGSSNLVFSFFS